jgi:hypothetical protein
MVAAKASTASEERGGVGVAKAAQHSPAAIEVDGNLACPPLSDLWMHRRAATALVLALAPMAACTPTGADRWEPEPATANPPSPPRQSRVEPWLSTEPGPTVDPFEAGCGAIEIEPLGPWKHEGRRMDEVRDGWHPRAEHGVPVAIREARAAVEVPGHRLWMVQVEGAPRTIQPCFMQERVVEPDLVHETCVPASMLVGQAELAARPRTNEQWAQLLGLLEGASAVYPDAAALERCVGSLPPQVRAAVPPLGLRRVGSELHATFVERIDVDAAGAELTMLVAVHATLEGEWLDLEHEELWTLDRRGTP